MATAEEKRKYPRWNLDKKIFCYLDGNRLDARSGNISLGGMFLCTDQATNMPLNSLVGLVFRSHESAQNTTFLFGKVVRKQEFPDVGVGLMWDKAVSVGPPELLTAFLKRLFNIAQPLIMEKTAGPEGKNKSIFKFSSLEKEIPLSTAIPGEPPESASDRSQKGPTVTSDEMEQLDEQEVRIEHTPAPDYVLEGNRLPHSDKHQGAITGMIHRSDLRAPTSQPGTLNTDGAEIDVTITHIGLDGLFVEVPLISANQGVDASVRFEITTRNGIIPITCNCRIAAVDDGSIWGTPGMNLEFTDVNEGEYQGILKRYVKWLHFNNLSKF